MHSSATYSSVLLAFLCTIVFRERVHAFPQFLGLVDEDRLSDLGLNGEHRSKEAGNMFYKQMISLLPKLFNDSASGAFSGFGELPPSFGSIPVFDGPFDVWEKYPWQAPGPYQRGPCPATNALANHGVINRSGVTTLWEHLEAVVKVFNLGLDIALITVILACIAGGDPVTMTYSIGGPDPRVQPPLVGRLGLFGEPQGLQFAHNMLETDASMTRENLFDTGDSWTLNMNLFMQLYKSVPGGSLFTHEAIASAACVRWYQCEQYSPNFYYGPGTGYFRNFAQMGLLLWGNHSDGSLDGKLTHDILFSFYGMTDDPVPFTYRKGWERIPENWYRRPQPFTMLDHIGELVKWFGWCPALASIGGNLGKPNSFAGVDLAHPAFGAFDMTNLFEGNKLLCFTLGALKMVAQSFSNNLYATLFGMLGEVTGTLGCPEVSDLSRGGVPLYEYLQGKYPGARAPSHVS